jgi:hypothetical protein
MRNLRKNSSLEQSIVKPFLIRIWEDSIRNWDRKIKHLILIQIN